MRITELDQMVGGRDPLAKKAARRSGLGAQLRHPRGMLAAPASASPARSARCVLQPTCRAPPHQREPLRSPGG